MTLFTKLTMDYLTRWIKIRVVDVGRQDIVHIGGELVVA